MTLDSLQHTLPALVAKGLIPADPAIGTTGNGSPVSFVEDPDGYTVELIERPDR